MTARNTAHPDLWTLALEHQAIDPEALASAVQAAAHEPEPDARTRLLLRDSLRALATEWGAQRFEEWLTRSPTRERLQCLLDAADLGPTGFPFLGRRIVMTTKREAVLEYLRELGSRMPSSVRLAIGGSVALILRDLISRRTEDIDVVDEVPRPLREEHELLRKLADRYGLHLTHFQSHYLPDGWADRVSSLGRFGTIEVFLVDEHDVALSKLFSAREKDLDDLRFLKRQLEKGRLADRVRTSGGRLLSEAKLRKSAELNWYVLYGEALPA